jgi:hypothetical protein
MNEQELRVLVREAVERHLGGKRGTAPFSERSEKGAVPLFPGSDPSHILLKIVPGSEAEDGACVIEPSVRCNHCGFCQSYGH